MGSTRPYCRGRDPFCGSVLGTLSQVWASYRAPSPRSSPRSGAGACALQVRPPAAALGSGALCRPTGPQGACGPLWHPFRGPFSGLVRVRSSPHPPGRRFGIPPMGCLGPTPLGTDGRCGVPQGSRVGEVVGRVGIEGVPGMRVFGGHGARGVLLPLGANAAHQSPCTGCTRATQAFRAQRPPL